MAKKQLVLFLLLIGAFGSFADTWRDPAIIIVSSQNNEYILKVYPIKYPANYFSPKYRRQYEKGIVNDTVAPCHAILYRISDSDTIEIWNKPLVNRSSPVRVRVANDGKSVVTFDDWFMRGGRHTMVVYGAMGELIEDFSLEDISPFPIDQYPQSVSSIYWGTGDYWDNDNLEIIFCNEDGEKKRRVFSISKRIFE